MTVHVKGRKEGNVLINNALSTFYLLLYGIRHMVKDHLAKEETSFRHIGYSFRLTPMVLLYAPSHSRIAHTMTFVTPVEEHWLEQEIVV